MLTGVRGPETAPRGLVDVRVARHGGTRKTAKSNYDFPGMTARPTWQRGKVNAATRYYACALCGTRFAGPHATYAHLAKIHDR